MKHIATWIEENRERHFNEVFSSSEYRLWNARIEPIPWDRIQALLLTGGCDISAKFLHQTVADTALIREPEFARDEWEFPALHVALGNKLPIFAICRGLQVLNVKMGGTLKLDIPGHDLPEQKYGNIQELQFAPHVRLRVPHVNSSHHQAIDKLGDGLDVEAWHEGDDIIEQVRLRDYPFCLAVQFHPERDKIYQPLFDAFGEHID